MPTPSSLRSALLDPAVNCLVQQLRNELQATKLRLEDTQNELSAWKFTPDSNTGKRLMAKCRMLYQENEELGKITSSGRIAILEGDLALQKSFSEEVRKGQLELDSLLADFDEDVEGMQSTILVLQQELRKAKEQLQQQQQQQQQSGEQQKQQQVMPNGRANGDSSVCVEQERTDSESEVERTRVKRVRRSSVLSIDYNEDDTLVINANGDVAMSSDPEWTDTWTVYENFSLNYYCWCFNRFILLQWLFFGFFFFFDTSRKTWTLCNFLTMPVILSRFLTTRV